MPNVNNPLAGNQPPSMFVPEPMVVTIGLFVTMLFTLIGWLAEKWKSAKKAAEDAKVPSKPPPPPAKKLLCLRDVKVYVAVGYGSSVNGGGGEIDGDAVFCQEENCVFVEGETGSVLINGLTRTGAASDVRDGFAQVLPEKPIKAVVVTGVVQSEATEVFMKDLEVKPEILAHERYAKEVNTYNDMATKLYKFSERIPRVNGMATTETFAGHHCVTIDGVDVEFVSTGMQDQFFVWLPKQKVLVTPDLFDRDYSRTHYFQAKYHTAGVLDMIELAKTFPAETLVPLHKYPVAGTANIADYLAMYKDAIKFSHDQTIQMMNQGYGPDDIVRILKSPPHLRRFLSAVNDTLDWRVRSVFNSYLGWYSGKDTELHSMGPAEEADAVMKLVRQDSDVIVNEAREALDKNDDAWALKLSQYLLDSGRRAKDALVLRKRATKNIRRKSIAHPPAPPPAKLGEETNNESSSDSDEPAELNMEKRLAEASNEELFTILGLNVDAERCSGLATTVSVTFSDASEDSTFHFAMRNGVLERLWSEPSEASRVKVTATGEEWRRIVLNKGVGEDLTMQRIVSAEDQVPELKAFLYAFDL